jgi:hypothetical protein
MSDPGREEQPEIQAEKQMCLAQAHGERWQGVPFHPDDCPR